MAEARDRAPAAPRRVVSLVPSLTELVVSLGAGDSLVGRTRYCVHPPAAVANVPVLGGTKDPDLAGVLACAPDLVLMNEEENRREDHDALRAAGLRCASFLPRRVDDVPTMVREVGTLLGRDPVGEELAAEIETCAAAARSDAVGAGASYAYLIWRRPWMVAARDTYIGGLLSVGGARNVFDAGYPEVSPEALRAADPDLVFLSSEPYPFREDHIDELTRDVGLPRARFRLVDGRVLSWHGAATLAGLELVRGLWNPDIPAM